MSTLVKLTHYTPDDLLKMPDGDRYELVDGQLVEHSMSYWSSYVASTLCYLLKTFCRAHRRGWVAGEGVTFQCFSDAPLKIRRPDVSFLSYDRWSPRQMRKEGHVPIPPDLAAEVVSPNDLYYEVERKVKEYLRAGVRLVWVINPETRTVRVYRADGTDSTLQEDGELSGEDVVAGFRCRVSDLFQILEAEVDPS